MREAKYAEAAKRAGKPAAAPKRAAARAPASPAAAAPEVEAGLCGHRNMSGRSCTREHGHAAKSHRYS
jgi:hypothetical protein